MLDLKDYLWRLYCCSWTCRHSKQIDRPASVCGADRHWNCAGQSELDVRVFLRDFRHLFPVVQMLLLTEKEGTAALVPKNGSH